MNFTLSWRCENSLGFGGHDLHGGIWAFLDFQPGSYQFRFTYSNQSPWYEITFPNKAEISDFWIGTVSTPLVPFSLVQP
ncbi:hypothetical protein IFO70_26980 [Phormidium tenue FACHB-886]|nr:hypothetical protein [Phormidium tenue FACHB-886]